ncbi:hypothetical protein [Kitasatospora sp. NPDC087315]|uniref:hypothetical protein n=1 Tax=Kitasatospora sp. NPDC087315 TaxID=3364069 RepID=UPI00381C32D3
MLAGRGLAAARGWSGSFACGRTSEQQVVAGRQLGQDALGEVVEPPDQAVPRWNGLWTLPLPEDLDALRRTTAARKAVAEEPSPPPATEGRTTALTGHPERCGSPGERTCICAPGDATGKTVGAAVEYAVLPSHHGRIAATVPLRGGRPGDVLYEIDWHSPPPPNQRHNRYTAIEQRLTRQQP